ncbi:Component of the sulfite reductase complex [Seminavis robusta]|uniref:Component of the sulfite reductase complex n=1 Tax=Seminavis robusta TaxID=568900 RepID=A0A9N8DRV5_9STRA|nr:Component of the sulfite reductase complex [Seminavis robusta]|eukprot:Sro237_g095370.1 Component of the sulfite reductase complex (207) ;mRNA; f:68021-68641
MAKRTEEVLVLYASQLGTSKRFARAFVKEMEEQLTSEAIQEYTHQSDGCCIIKVVPTLMTLDDFLEERQAAWTRLVVIFVSSYNGAAPKGGPRFRDLCDTLKSPIGIDPHMLTGLKYAICGLGSSSYTTYFENPTAVNDGLTAAGATRVGEFGEADMQKRGEYNQRNVVARWKKGIWKELAQVLIEEPLPPERLLEMQAAISALKY